MVLYFTPRGAEVTKHVIYVGADKHENEELIGESGVPKEPDARAVLAVCGGPGFCVRSSASAFASCGSCRRVSPQRTQLFRRRRWLTQHCHLPQVMIVPHSAFV